MCIQTRKQQLPNGASDGPEFCSRYKVDRDSLCPGEQMGGWRLTWRS